MAKNINNHTKPEREQRQLFNWLCRALRYEFVISAPNFDTAQEYAKTYNGVVVRELRTKDV